MRKPWLTLMNPDLDPIAGLVNMVFEAESFNELDTGPATVLTLDEAFDPLEEIDIYGASGDFEQAVDIVKRATTRQPSNNQFKLCLFKVNQSGGMSFAGHEAQELIQKT